PLRFFFSSRRRHTRFSRDWSSDVCSSDLGEVMRMSGLTVATVEQEPALDDDATIMEFLCGDYIEREDWQRPAVAGALIDQLGLQIGRASCRERVLGRVAPGAVKNSEDQKE